MIAMAYDLVVQRVQVDVATISGWRQFRLEVGEFGVQLQKLFDRGEADDAIELARELRMLDDLSGSSVSIRQGMLSVLAGKTGNVILTDGMTDEDVDEDWEVGDF